MEGLGDGGLGFRVWWWWWGGYSMEPSEGVFRQVTSLCQPEATVFPPIRCSVAICSSSVRSSGEPPAPRLGVGGGPLRLTWKR